jgi:hypothetical protein
MVYNHLGWSAQNLVDCSDNPLEPPVKPHISIPPVNLKEFLQIFIGLFLTSLVAMLFKVTTSQDFQHWR